MSICIRNAWATRTPLVEIMQHAQTLRTEVHKGWIRGMASYLRGNPSLSAVERLKMAETVGAGILGNARLLNPTSSLVLYPLPSVHVPGWLNLMSPPVPCAVVHVFGVLPEQRGAQEAFARSIKGSEVWYDTSEERPDDLTDSQWADRRALWETLLPGWSAPHLNGFTFTLMSETEALEGLLAAFFELNPPGDGWEGMFYNNPPALAKVQVLSFKTVLRAKDGGDRELWRSSVLEGLRATDHSNQSMTSAAL